MRRLRAPLRAACAATLTGLLLGAPQVAAAPRVVLISLDGAKPDLVERYQQTGALPRSRGLGRLERFGVRALQNVTATPSVTAVSHIAIATGSSAVHNDIPANTFHPVAASIGTSLSGFGAPIGGYHLAPLGPTAAPTAEPLWVRLSAQGGSVVTATWPGSDGADIRIAGTLVQAAVPGRTNDYTVPFGAFGGLGAQGHTLTAASFTAAGEPLLSQLAAAGLVSFAPIRVTIAPIETVFCAPLPTSSCGTTDASGRTTRYELRVAALDTKDDGLAGYDTLVVFDAVAGIAPGPHALPSTGPAVRSRRRGLGQVLLRRLGRIASVRRSSSRSSRPICRRSASFATGRTSFRATRPVLADVDDVNANVGFWAPQPDFRIPERLSPGFTSFPDVELEAVYRDQVVTFTDYQTGLALHAIERKHDADLVMIYLEQPDGSGHQFTLTDPRQATDPLDAKSIGWPGFPAGATGQDREKQRRYAAHLEFAYQSADRAVERIVQKVGVDPRGAPRSDVFVVSDHGMAPFHTAVSLRNLLVGPAIDPTLIGLRTTGPAAHVYVNLAGREAGGTVTPEAYPALVEEIARALRRGDGSERDLQSASPAAVLARGGAPDRLRAPGLLHERRGRTGLRRRARAPRRGLQLRRHPGAGRRAARGSAVRRRIDGVLRPELLRSARARLGAALDERDPVRGRAEPARGPYAAPRAEHRHRAHDPRDPRGRAGADGRRPRDPARPPPRLRKLANTTRMRRRVVADGVRSACAGLLLAACAFGAPQAQPMASPAAPLVIGHRGAPGYLPEHTLASYALAIELGADCIEPDLVATKDGALIARHEPNLAGTTDVAKHPEFEARFRTDHRIDGVPESGWFTSDFTLAEIRTLRAVQALPNERYTGLDGLFPIPTLDEVIELAQTKALEEDREICIVPETKHPTYHRELGLPLEDALVETLRRHGWSGPDAPAFIQSFEPESLKYLDTITGVRLVQLIDGDPAATGLDEVASYADAIGVSKQYLASAAAPTSLLVAAHARGLLVFAWTFRREQAQLRAAYEAGVDGVFADFPDVAYAARAQFRLGKGLGPSR